MFQRALLCAELQPSWLFPCKPMLCTSAWSIQSLMICGLIIADVITWLCIDFHQQMAHNSVYYITIPIRKMSYCMMYSSTECWHSIRAVFFCRMQSLVISRSMWLCVFWILMNKLHWCLLFTCFLIFLTSCSSDNYQNSVVAEGGGRKKKPGSFITIQLGNYLHTVCAAFL